MPYSSGSPVARSRCRSPKNKKGKHADGRQQNDHGVNDQWPKPISHRQTPDWGHLASSRLLDRRDRKETNKTGRQVVGTSSDDPTFPRQAECGIHARRLCRPYFRAGGDPPAPLLSACRSRISKPVTVFLHHFLPFLGWQVHLSEGFWQPEQTPFLISRPHFLHG